MFYLYYLDHIGLWGAWLHLQEGSQYCDLKLNFQKTMKEERLLPAALLTLGIWLGQSLSGN